MLETAVNGRADLLVTFNERENGTVPEPFADRKARGDFKAFDKIMKHRGGKPRVSSAVSKRRKRKKS